MHTVSSVLSERARLHKSRAVRARAHKRVRGLEHVMLVSCEHLVKLHSLEIRLM